jgi:hypothetical protein
LSSPLATFSFYYTFPENFPLAQDNTHQLTFFKRALTGQFRPTKPPQHIGCRAETKLLRFGIAFPNLGNITHQG